MDQIRASPLPASHRVTLAFSRESALRAFYCRYYLALFGLSQAPTGSAGMELSDRGWFFLGCSFEALHDTAQKYCADMNDMGRDGTNYIGQGKQSVLSAASGIRFRQVLLTNSATVECVTGRRFLRRQLYEVTSGVELPGQLRQRQCVTKAMGRRC